MKQITTFVLTTAFLLQAFPVPVYAEGELRDLQLQLRALSLYLERVQGTPVREPLTEADMRTVIQSGTQWLLAAQEPSGHFAYEYVPHEDRYRADDNMVRQAGALFALGEVYRRQSVKDEDVAEGIEKAISYFEKLTIKGEDGSACVANSEKSSSCKLGTTALVLAGMLGYVEGNPEVEEKYRERITHYTRYILASQKRTGGFSASYSTRTGFSSEESSFFNGEALLSLVRVYRYEEDADVKKVIDTAFAYLQTTPFDNPLYLWIMAALKDMQKLWPSEEYVTYAQAFTVWRMARAPRPFTDRNYCAYSEGLASAYSILHEESSSELRSLRQELDAFNAYHAQLQLSSRDAYVVSVFAGVPALQKLVNTDQLAGGFLTAFSEPTQRIDFTQHCISAYMQTLVDIDGKKL